MFTEELNVIIDTEEKAEKIKRDAKEEAKAVLARAEDEAKKILEAGEAEAKKLMGEARAEGERQAEEDYRQSLEKTDMLCAELEKSAESRIPQVVSLMTERIVRDSGNR